MKIAPLVGLSLLAPLLLGGCASASQHSDLPVSPSPSALPAPSHPLAAYPAQIDMILPSNDLSGCLSGDDAAKAFHPHAWQVDGALVCGTEAPAWDGRVIDFKVYFPSPVSGEAATQTAKKLLPADINYREARTGTNSPRGNAIGTCAQAEYSSPLLGAEIRLKGPSPIEAQNLATVTYYSGPVSADGASVPLDFKRVAVVDVSIGGFNVGQDGLVHC